MVISVIVEIVVIALDVLNLLAMVIDNVALQKEGGLNMMDSVHIVAII